MTLAFLKSPKDNPEDWKKPKDFLIARIAVEILFLIALGFNPRQLKKDCSEKPENGLKNAESCAPKPSQYISNNVGTSTAKAYFCIL